MWQTIEYKSAAIEQFRKGDLLQRVIDDVTSEAANAAEMKAAASGNPLILMQVQLAGELRKLEALYSQHQKGQHRLRDRLKWLNSTEKRLAKAESTYAENIRLRDTRTHAVTEKGKQKIRLELLYDGNILTGKDSKKIQDILVGGIKEVTRKSSAEVPFGNYRGFDMTIVRASGFGSDGFRIILQGADNQQFQPDNLRYSFDDQLSLSGLFQRMDNFLTKGLDEAVETQRENARQELAELETVKAALGKKFPQREELALARENHGAVIRELQRMQDDASYVSTWTPKTAVAVEPPAMEGSGEQKPGTGEVAADSVTSKEPQFHKLTFPNGKGRSEYTVSNQHNGYTLDGYVLRYTYFSSTVGSIGQSWYTDDQWHSTSSAPRGVKLRQFATVEEAMKIAHEDAVQRGLEETAAQQTPTKMSTYHDRLTDAGFCSTGKDFYGKSEHELTIDAGDGGTFRMRVFQSAGEQVGLRVQYEKYNLIDDSRTVNTQFNTLDETLDYVEGYRRLAAPQAKAEAPMVSSANGVQGFVISSPRMR